MTAPIFAFCQKIETRLAGVLSSVASDLPDGSLPRANFRLCGFRV